MQNIVETRDFVSFNRSFWSDVSWELTSPPFFNSFPRNLRARAGLSWLSNRYKCDRPRFRQQFKLFDKQPLFSSMWRCSNNTRLQLGAGPHSSPGATSKNPLIWGSGWGASSLTKILRKIYWYGAPTSMVGVTSSTENSLIWGTSFARCQLFLK